MSKSQSESADEEHENQGAMNRRDDEQDLESVARMVVGMKETLDDDMTGGELGNGESIGLASQDQDRVSGTTTYSQRSSLPLGTSRRSGNISSRSSRPDTKAKGKKKAMNQDDEEYQEPDTQERPRKRGKSIRSVTRNQKTRSERSPASGGENPVGRLRYVLGLSPLFSR